MTHPSRHGDRLRGLLAERFSAADTRILIADRSGALIYLNPAMEAYLGSIARDNLPNHNHFLPFSGQASNLADLPLPAAFRVLFARAAKKHEATDEVFALDGTAELSGVAVRVAPLVLEHGSDELLVVTLEPKEPSMSRPPNDGPTRERLEDFARSTSDWFWETDLDGRISFVNDQVLRSTGQLASSLRGRTLAAIGVFVDADGYESPSHAMAHKLPFRDKIMMTVNRQGEERLLRVSGVPIFEVDSGRFTGYRGTATDVTEEHRFNEQIKQVNEQLREAVTSLETQNSELDVARDEVQSALNARNEFLASMSHELRTPLNGIIGFSEVMSSQLFGELNEKYQEYAGDIQRAGEHLLSLIDDLLDASRLDTDELEVYAKPFSLNEVVDQALSVLRREHEAKNQTISYEPRKKSPVVMADARRVKQILLNLLGNAIKFTPARGTIGIDVKKVKETDEAGRQVAITIWDTGPGIAEEFQGRMFDKFARGGGSVYEHSEKGFGLGLYISDHLASRMDGRLLLSHSSSEGSAFTLTLPLSDAQSPRVDGEG